MIFEDDINLWCCARTPLRHGSKKCGKHAIKGSDVCQQHAAELWPNQLIDGTLYLGDGNDEEGFPTSNPFNT